MIAMVEGAKRQKTPNEIALTILLAAFTLIFLLALRHAAAVFDLQRAGGGHGHPITLTVLVALLVCLIPDHDRRPAVGHRHCRHGPHDPGQRDRHVRPRGRSGRRRGRAAARQDRHDHARQSPGGGVPSGAGVIESATLADAAQLASLADETPEGRSIVVLAKEKFGLRGRDVEATARAVRAVLRADAHERCRSRRRGRIRKGALDAVENTIVEAQGGHLSAAGQAHGRGHRAPGGTPLVVAEGARVLGVIELKDIVKGGIKERFAELRRMGIKTVMITGDNPLTAAAIAAEAGVDDFLAEATPEAKLKLIRDIQARDRLVAMTGDGTNDAPALAQADVAVAMNTGTQAAKEAGNMVDLDSNPTKLIEVVEIGKQLLMTRGALTTFCIANDVAKYFAIIPAAFATTYPALNALNVMHLATPQSAILSAVIFNALIIIFLIPLALQGREIPRARRRCAAAPQPAGLRPGRHRRAVHRHQAHRHVAGPVRTGLIQVG